MLTNEDIRFHPTDHESLLCYSKRAVEGDCTLVVANPDPVKVNAQSGWVNRDLGALRIGPDMTFAFNDLLAGAGYQRQGPRNYVVLDPAEAPAHVFHLPGAAAPGQSK